MSVVKWNIPKVIKWILVELDAKVVKVLHTGD